MARLWAGRRSCDGFSSTCSFLSAAAVSARRSWARLWASCTETHAARFLWDGEPTRYRRATALFRPPSPKPIVQLLLQWAFQHHLLRETDIGFRLIGLPYVTSWWQVVQSTSVLRF